MDLNASLSGFTTFSPLCAANKPEVLHESITRINEPQLSYNSWLLPQFHRDTLVLFVVRVGRDDWREEDVEKTGKNASFKCTAEWCEIQ